MIAFEVERTVAQTRRPSKFFWALILLVAFAVKAQALEISGDRPWVAAQIYFYSPSKQSLQIQYSSDLNFANSNPLAQKNGWTVVANERGDLRLPGGVRATSLLWNGQSAKAPKKLESGVVLRAQDVRSYLNWQLPRLGLHGREVHDFIQTWAPKLEKYTKVQVEFLANDKVDKYVPLSLSHPIAQIIRVYLNYQEAPASMAETEDFSALEVDGFSPIENSNRLANGEVIVEAGAFRTPK